MAGDAAGRPAGHSASADAVKVAALVARACEDIADRLAGTEAAFRDGGPAQGRDSHDGGEQGE